MVEKLVLDLYIKNQNWAYLWLNNRKLYLFIVCPSRGLPKYVKKLRCWALAFTLNKAFLKTKGDLELFFQPHFLHDFWKKIFLMLHLINCSNLIARLPLLPEILRNTCIVVVYCPVCDVKNSEINHTFLIEPFFYIIVFSTK